MTQDLFDLLVDPPRADVRAVTATVDSATKDVALLTCTDGTPGIMPLTEFYPNRRWQVGSRYFLLAMDATARPTLSARRPELVELLLAGLSPELRTGQVRVMRVVRQVGIRSKIAVAATMPGVDPVGACLGRGANRVQALSRMLLGERIDVVAWHADLEVFVRNALGTKVLDAEFSDGAARLTVPHHQYQAAVGGGGLNAALVSRLTGLRLTISPGN